MRKFRYTVRLPDLKRHFDLERARSEHETGSPNKYPEVWPKAYFLASIIIDRDGETTNDEYYEVVEQYRRRRQESDGNLMI